MTRVEAEAIAALLVRVEERAFLGWVGHIVMVPGYSMFAERSAPDAEARAVEVRDAIVRALLDDVALAPYYAASFPAVSSNARDGSLPPVYSTPTGDVGMPARTWRDLEFLWNTVSATDDEFYVLLPMLDENEEAS